MPKKNAKNNEITLYNDIQLESMTIQQLEKELDSTKNRISKLNNNYEIRFSAGKKEYKEPEKQEKVERIYAELDNNNKYIEDEIEKKSEKTPLRDNAAFKKSEVESDNTKNKLYNEEEKNNLKDVEFPEYEN